MRGADKLLETIYGAPQITRITMAAIATGCPVIIALPPDKPLRNLAISNLQAIAITVENPSEGMAASIRAGIAQAEKHPGLMILPADMPELETRDLQAMLAAFKAEPTAIHRATSATGNLGHPVVFPSDLFPDLAQIKGDEGAKSILKQHKDRLRVIALKGNRATTDLDTPEEWAAWRAARTDL